MEAPLSILWGLPTEISILVQADAVVDVGEGVVGVDFGEVDDVVQIVKLLLEEAVVFDPTIDTDKDLGGVGDDKNLKGGNGEIGVAFFAEVDAAG